MDHGREAKRCSPPKGQRTFIKKKMEIRHHRDQIEIHPIQAKRIIMHMQLNGDVPVKCLIEFPKQVGRRG